LLPSAHVAYSWLALTLLQDSFNVAPGADYRGVALAAMGSDLIDKPLAAAYFYRKHKAAVLFAHTLLAYVAVAALTWARWPRSAVYGVTWLGHALLDRIWFFPNTFYWPLRGWRFHVWGKQGSEQKEIGKAYWFAFTRRPELWIWEVGGLLALAWVIWRHKLYQPRRLWHFLVTGRAAQ
jgi:inner membrane protein